MDARFLSDHLLLLVGGNPLPNAIAGKVLTRAGGTITLLHSEGTAGFAQKLQIWLRRQGISDVRLISVHEADPGSIIRGAREVLQKNSNVASIGLNYTGGTKAMSVHVYRTLEQWAAEQRKEGKELKTLFSYLDAHKLEMVFDPADPMSGDTGYAEYVGDLKLKLEELLELHGWTLKHNPTRTPILQNTARVLLDIHAHKDTAKIWGEWLQTELFKKARRREQISVNCRRSPDGQACMVEQPTEKWLSKNQLKKVLLEWPSAPALQALTETMKNELQQADMLNLGDGAELCGYRDPEDFCKWLNGIWLEHSVLQTLGNLAGNLQLHEYAQNIETQEVQFDLDVIAIRGYQLFAFSCSTDTEEVKGGKERLKTKLFEAFVRVSQLGGDEARAALVCCSDRPDELQREMQRDIDPEGHFKVDSEGRIKVFGRKDFVDLVGNLSKWIQSQGGKE
jgi:hypothetical protein